MNDKSKPVIEVIEDEDVSQDLNSAEPGLLDYSHVDEKNAMVAAMILKSNNPEQIQDFVDVDVTREEQNRDMARTVFIPKGDRPILVSSSSRREAVSEITVKTSRIHYDNQPSSAIIAERIRHLQVENN